jgi:hypothetical protein
VDRRLPAWGRAATYGVVGADLNGSKEIVMSIREIRVIRGENNLARACE